MATAFRSSRRPHLFAMITDATAPLASPAKRALSDRFPTRADVIRLAPAILIACAFVAVFVRPFVTLLSDWWNLPEAGHGLLLAPVALWLAWRSGFDRRSTPNVVLGTTILVAAVIVRLLSALAVELFTMRLSMIAALLALVVYFYGVRQAAHWWLPFVLLLLCVPLPELVTQALALPLQFKASQMGAALLEIRHVPVRLTGNIIRIPGHELFVTEACSGLRSLTALLSTGILVGAMLLRTPVARVVLLLLAIPVAIAVNGVRVFLTGFFVYFVSPSFGTGFMHATEGWLLFLVSLGGLAALATLGMSAERLYFQRRHHE